MDKIFIRELQIKATIGIFEWEKKIEQTLIVDLEFDIDNRKAAQNDDINQTINYDHIVSTIKEVAENQPYNLVETLAEKIATTLLHNFEIHWLQLRINKLHAIKNAKGVGVLIERKK